MIIEAVVKPGAREFRAEWREGKLHVALTEQAEKNKANIELIKKLSALLGCEVRIVSGLTSKRKKLELSIDENEMKKRLEEKA